VQRYYLVSEEPSGEFVEVIIPVTDAGRRRYFATSDGERLTEVDEDYFVGRGAGSTRSLLELDAREMAELQAELNFVRPVLGRDPLAEIGEAETEPAAATEVAESAEAAWVPVAWVSDAEKQADAPEPAEAEWEEDDPEPTYDAPAPAAAMPAHVPPPPEPPPAPRSPALAEPAWSAYEADDQDDDDDDDADDDEETIEESDVVMGTSVYEGVEPVASVPPVDVAPVTVAASGDAPAQAPEGHTTAAHVPAHAATAHGAPAHASPADSTPAHDAAVDAAAQVSLAKGIAFVAHRGQLDLVGAEYIDHPGRVAERFDPLAEPVPTAVAWLHDVLEDTAVTAQELLEAGVLPEIVELVQLLTRTADVADDEYYARIRRHPVALRVKLADLDDNSAPWRLRRLDYAEQLGLSERHAHARRALDAD
jgi:hypothetical protein